MAPDFSLFRFLRRNKNKYKRYKTYCLAGVLLIAMYAMAVFPGYYSDGLSGEEWTMMLLLILSGYVLLYMERSFSSKDDSRLQDWKSSRGSMQAFAFANYCCLHCGRKLILASLDKRNKLHLIAPGQSIEPELDSGFYCVHCKKFYGGTNFERREFSASRLRPGQLFAFRPQFKDYKSYRLDRAFINRHALVSLLMLLATISCFYFARTSAVRLILPIFIGYLTFVSIYNFVYYVSIRYYLTSSAVIQLSLWSYSVFRAEDMVAFVCFSSEQGEKTWGLITSKENLLISPMIFNRNELTDKIKQFCKDNSIPVIS